MKGKKVAAKAVAMLVLGISSLFLVSRVKAATIYVDAANTSGIEDGSLVHPFNTIQEGINTALEGDSFETADTVRVAPGIYYGGGIRLKHNVRLIGSDPETTIIDGQNQNYVSAIQMPVHSEPRGYIEGFTIKNAWLGIDVRNPYIFWQPSYLEIHKCIIKDCSTYGIAVYSYAKVKVVDTVFTRITCGALCGLWCLPVELTNVTIDNVAYFGGSALRFYGNEAYLTNSIISNTPTLFSVWANWGDASINAKNNCFWNYQNEWKLRNNNPYQFVNSNSLYINPLYVDISNSDYHLQPVSPCIDDGVDVGLPYSGSAPDLGAYEYEELNTHKLVENLASSYAETSLDSFKNSAEERINALENKFVALLNKLNEIDETQDTPTKIALYRDALDKLLNDIWAKGDGFFGGNPKNDWITTREEQERLYPKVEQLKKNIEKEINTLLAAQSAQTTLTAAPSVRPQGNENRLSQNYPNPFNPSTTIEYTIEKDCVVTIKLYNITGQLVATVVDEHQSAGPHKVVFDGGEKLSRGVYYYQLKAGNFVATKKMVVLK